MDLLKVLSRGTKKTHISTPPATSSRPTSSELSHETTRGVKRKRKEGPSLTASDNGAVNVDFFAPAESQKSVAPVTEDKGTTVDDIPQSLDLNEIRNVLRTHKLKFTLLSRHDDDKPKARKSKKKEQVKTKSKEKLQLFPRPLTSFTELRSTYNISPRLVENVAKQGFRLPTEVQLGSLPLLLDPTVALSHRSADDAHISTDKPVNLLAVSPTGSGKTLSFLIPTINSVLRRRAGSSREEHDVEALVIAPTRELVHQIVSEGHKLAAGTGVKVVGYKKGMRIPTSTGTLNLDDGSDSGQEDTASALESPAESDSDAEPASRPVTHPDVLVTTPGTLLSFLKKRGTPRQTLPTVRSIILDEGDVLLDPLFRDQTLQLISSCTHDSLQLTCWSATMGSSIESLLTEKLGTPDRESATGPLIRLVVGLKDAAVPTINHHLLYTGDNERGKLYTLRQFLHPSSADTTVPDLSLPCLVFVQTIERAMSLHDELKFEFPPEAGGVSRVATLHSTLSESARSKIIARFRAGEIWLLITTDLMMRGLDFRGVHSVINYDIPLSAAAYVHRVGRTGRLKGSEVSDVAVTFYTKEDIPYLKSIANVIALSEKQAGKDGDEGIPKWLMDALPKVRKDEKKKLKGRGVESRRGAKAEITSKSTWEKRKENNRRGAIAGSKKRKFGEQGDSPDELQDSEWEGLDN